MLKRPNEQCERCGEGAIYAHVLGDTYEINGSVYTSDVWICRECTVAARKLGLMVDVIC